MIKKIRIKHVGEIIKEDFLDDYGLTQYALANALGIPHSRMTNILHGKTRITPDTAARLARVFGNRAQWWLGLQNDYDLSLIDTRKIEREAAPVPVPACA